MAREASRAAEATSWREPILSKFTRDIASVTRLTIVADPDELLAEQYLLDELRTRGFELIPFEDPVAFRFVYENQYRTVWDQGAQTTLVVVLRTAHQELDAIPFDLLEMARSQGRCLRISLGELFPKLAPSVLSELEPSSLDPLYRAEAERSGGVLGENPTRDHVLHHVFEVVPDLVREPAELLRLLLRRHYRRQHLPESLDQHLINRLRSTGSWDDWPLEEIVPSRSSFLGFLEERWPLYLKSQLGANPDAVAEATPAYGLTYEGPQDLPFGHDDVRVYIDNLFQEGGLKPTDQIAVASVPLEWMRVGVVTDDSDDQIERFRRLHARLEDALPGADASHRDWVEYAYLWAEWNALRWERSSVTATVTADECDTIHDQTEEAFRDWIFQHFGSLHNLSVARRPAMVHHIPHYMARDLVGGCGNLQRMALVVIDGLALDQWVVLRQALGEQLAPANQVEEDGAFAWVPTLTAVSRQSIFAGEAPIFFESSLQSTRKEPAHWQRFWENVGVSRPAIGYVRQGRHQTDDAFLVDVLAVSEHPATRVLGVVVGTVDETMHGIVTGSGGLHGVVRDWAVGGAVCKLVDSLLKDGYEVLITADHGNITGDGMGKPNVGAIADERGERAHVFSDDNTRANTKRQFPGSIEWPQIGLPDGYRPLLAPGRNAFIKEGTTAVGHGGISLEEVIVPFVRISKGVE